MKRLIALAIVSVATAAGAQAQMCRTATDCRMQDMQNQINALRQERAPVDYTSGAKPIDVMEALRTIGVIDRPRLSIRQQEEVCAAKWGGSRATKNEHQKCLNDIN